MGEQDTWALVTDGVRARILRGVGTGGGPAPGELVSRARSAHLRARLASHPDIAHRGGGGGVPRAGSLADMQAIHADMVDFTRETLRLLDQHRLAGDFGRLAVFAPATVFAICREEAPARLAKVITQHPPIDLVGVSEGELRRVVTRAIASQRRGTSGMRSVRRRGKTDVGG